MSTPCVLKQDVRANGNRRAALPGRVETKIRTGGRFLNPNDMETQPPNPISIRVETSPSRDFPRMTLECVKDISRRRVKPESSGDNHLHRFGHEPVIGDGFHGQWAGGIEVREPADIVFTMKREAPVFESGYESRFIVIQILNVHRICERSLLERKHPVR